MPAYAAPPDSIDMLSFVLATDGSGEFKMNAPSLGDYAEGSCLPTLIEVKNRDDVDKNIPLTVVFDYKHNGNPTDVTGIEALEEIQTSFASNPRSIANISDFTFTGNDLTMVGSFESTTGTVYTTITGPFSGNSGENPIQDTDTERHYNIVLQSAPADETVSVLFCARLGQDVSAYPGASLHLDAGGGGKIQVKISELLILPSLTIEKAVADGNARPDMWSFNVSPQIDEQSSFDITEGESSVTIENITTGIYEITEGTGPDEYSFAYGNGTNCVFEGATAVVDLKPAKPQIQAICTFTNSMEPIAPPATTGTLIIVKDVINDDGGTGVAEDFELNLDYFNVQATTTETFAGNASGTEFVFEAGPYSVYETESDGYTASYSEGCSGDLKAGTTATCIVTNNDIYTPPEGTPTGTLTVVKYVMNSSERDVSAQDFTLKIHLTTSSTVQNVTFQGSADGTEQTLPIGEYSVEEVPTEGYYAEYSGDCQGYLAEGDEKTCWVYNYETNDENTARLIIKKVVINDNGRTATSSDFTMNVTYTEPRFYGNGPRVAVAYVLAVLPQTATTSFPGDDEGTEVTVGPGEYSVTETEDRNYTATYSETCSGTIEAGQTVTCVITNNDKTQGGGGSSSGGGGGGSTFAGFLGGTPTASPAPTPMVLGAEDTAPRCTLTEIEALQVSSIVNEVLGYLGLSRDMTLEDYFNAVLTPRVAPIDLDAAILATVRNFVNYGTKSNLRLGQGERAGVLDSYKAIYGRMPVDECDWQNAIKIGNTTLPKDLNTEREKAMEVTFSKIYGMSVDKANANHDVALKVMAYGIRPQIRDLDAERTAIGVFERIFGKKPATATEWDANRAIAYSGIAHSLLSKDLTKAASKIMSIRINNEAVR